MRDPHNTLYTSYATLRLTPTVLDQQNIQVEIAFEKQGISFPTAIVTPVPSPTTQDQEDLRWYLEDYLQYSFDPAPAIAARIEQHFDAYGRALFQTLFQNSNESRRIWASVHEDITHTRVEIVSNPADTITIPWEWLRDPEMNDPLAVCVQSFVRVASHTLTSQLPSSAELVRILLVICRPGREDDVPFRSVASRLIRGLGDNEYFQLEVLRPPSFLHLVERLQTAQTQGRPYHIVHFDGHGIYTDPVANTSGTPSKHMRGYVIFEKPGTVDNTELIHGKRLAEVLTATGVPLLLLNACRSAHAEISAEPGISPVHERTRAFGSFAQEAISAGVAGVIAMSYNVYVETAAQFIANLYAALANGKTLGEATMEGRKQLYTQPLRENGLDPHILQDWVVPVVYENTLIAPFFRTQIAGEISLAPMAVSTIPTRGLLDPKLPLEPQMGFIGRDETLLNIDRAFDIGRVVLLHAYAGSGKTSATAEFARWYTFTEGVEIALFTSFEHYKPLTQVLNEIERVFGTSLSQQGIHWFALSDVQRREAALQILSQHPFLWIWDNVEAVAGFPEGTPSAWSALEQQELQVFLQAAQQTKARLLLTSRRNESTWLRDIPVRITIPPMPMLERVQMLRAIAKQRGQPIVNLLDWQPLLAYSQGNPLMLSVTVQQILRDGLQTHEALASYVEQLQIGEVAFTDDLSEGRSRSLGASLKYGFEHSFNEKERKKLALLYFFQGFVDIRVLLVMTDPENEIGLSQTDDLSADQVSQLLGRAAEVGLLTAYNDGYYSIHPALPWFFKNLFDQYYPASQMSGDGADLQVQAAHAFVRAIAVLANLYHDQYERGNRALVQLLHVEEPNLLRARQLAQSSGWWRDIIGPMQGLRALYSETGRWAEWMRLVNEIIPQFCDPVTDGPLPGRERQWSLVMGYRVELARLVTHRLDEAERLQLIRVDWGRRRTAPLLISPINSLQQEEQRAIRSFAVAVEDLGQTQRDLDKRECFQSFNEAIQLYRHINDQAAEAVVSISLAHAYLDFDDPDQCQTWITHSLTLLDENDRLMRGTCYTFLGISYLEKYTIEGQKVREGKRPHDLQVDEELVSYIEKAEESCLVGLQLLPQEAANQLADIHTTLGRIYGTGASSLKLPNGGSDFRNLAIKHFQEAIRYKEEVGGSLDAAKLRISIGALLFTSGRLNDAQLYMQSALSTFESFRDQAETQRQLALQLLQQIEEAKRK